MRLTFEGSAGPRVAIAKTVLADALEQLMASGDTSASAYRAIRSLTEAKALLDSVRLDNTPTWWRRVNRWQETNAAIEAHNAGAK